MSATGGGGGAWISPPRRSSTYPARVRLVVRPVVRSARLRLLVVLLLALTVLGGGLAVPADAATASTLASGATLRPGQKLVSPNGKFQAKMQTNGNFVLSRLADAHKLASTATHVAGSRLVMQANGNLVLRSPDDANLWSRTQGTAGAVLTLRNDGNLTVVQRDGDLAWSSPFAVPVSTGSSTEVVTVVSGSATATTAKLTAWKLTAGGWSIAYGPVKAYVGAKGIGTAKEGSTRTPAGTFTLTEAFGRKASPGGDLPYRKIDAKDWWVSDVSSAKYNKHARCAVGSCSFDESDGENLWAAGAVYNRAVVIDYNRSPVVKGAGSAFFLHLSNGHATAGCVAIADATLKPLIAWLDPARKPIIAIQHR